MDLEILNEISKPDKTALVVWDVQNALVERIFNREEFLFKLEELIAAARNKGVPIFFSKITPLSERFESGPRKLMRRKRPMNFTSDGLELTVSPVQNDIVIPKNTASIFIGTNFELMVRNAGINTLIFTGIATEIGVESSGRDALNRGFFAVVAKEDVSSANKEAHECSLKNMDSMLVVMDNTEIRKMWGI
jgi:nicotinamidase-related amidase